MESGSLAAAACRALSVAVQSSGFKLLISLFYSATFDSLCLY